MNSPDNSPTARLQPEDLAILAAIQRGNEWLRAVLCTLARRGTAFRRTDPERAQQLLQVLSPFPWYKGGQFLFDLMEWEDFMLDGHPPEIVSTTLDARALKRIAALLTTLKGYLDSSFSDELLQNLKVEVESSTDQKHNLPPLEPGFYLYQDVVLGVLNSAAPLVLASESPDIKP